MRRVGRAMKRFGTGTALTIGALLCGASGAGAEVSASVGRQLYVESCAACHGLDGRGGGAKAGDLMVPPPDLTKLHEKYGSPLRRDEVAAFIDGRTDVAAHGPREMPVWGERLFEGDPGPPRGVETARRRTIDVLIDYLQQLQGMEETRLRRPATTWRGR